jgi:tRNA-Thr(GGU) m(6)t(6)A37 methyltransferase TsaA
MTGMAPTIPLPVIGIVASRYTSTEDTPIQARLNSEAQACVEIAERYADGLDGLENFDFAWLLTWLHQPRADAGPPALRHTPFLLRRQQRKVGIFATRGPRRVNPIGLSLIRVTGISGRVVHFSGVDLIDGTPVLDIKPYVTRFDRPPGEPRCGWFDEITIADGSTPSGLGPADGPIPPDGD